MPLNYIVLPVIKHIYFMFLIVNAMFNVACNKPVNEVSVEQNAEFLLNIPST